MRKELISVKILVVAAMLSAISIICGKYLAFGIGNVLRFSFENLPILFAGIAFGPLAGALVGAVADLVGCLLVGYEINPLVTIGAVAVGAVSGGCHLLFKKAKASSAFSITLSVILAHLIGSVVIKTFGLAAFYSFPLYILMLWRLFKYILVGCLECILIFMLLRNRAVCSAIISIKGGHL